MKPKHILSASILSLVLASCSNEAEEAASGQSVPLQIKTEIQSTRAGINATQFDKGDQIGLFMMKDGSLSSECLNVKAITNDNGKTWEMSRQVMLDNTPAVVYAYYPWEESVNTSAGISLSMDMTSQTNYLYGIVSGVYSEKPVASIQFKHALAKVDFLINNDEGKAVSNVSVSGSKLFTTGQFNVATMSFIPATTGKIDSKNIVRATDTQYNATFLLTPVTDQQLSLNVVCADGTTYTGTFIVSSISMGQHVSYSVNIEKDAPMTISETSIEDWGVAEVLEGVTALTPNDNGHSYIDLGLPSGTLWATCNIGASSPEESGEYYAWGETVAKEVYDWNTYKFIDKEYSEGNGCNKYQYEDSQYDGCWYVKNTETEAESQMIFKGDKKTVLDPEDDVAHVIWGGDWRMPTKKDFAELYNECDWTWMVQNGKAGYKVTKNNRSIFLPAAGYCSSSIKNGGANLYYWASTLYLSDSKQADLLYNKPEAEMPSNHIWSRYYGLSVRPVIVSKSNQK